MLRVNLRPTYLMTAAALRCNTVVPGVIDTPADRAATPTADRGTGVAPAGIARVVLFLASGASAPVSGATGPVHERA